MINTLSRENCIFFYKMLHCRGLSSHHQTCIFTVSVFFSCWDQSNHTIRHGQDQGGEQNQNGERHQCTESLLTSGNGLKEENKTYLAFFSWIHSRAISTVEVLGKSFHIFKGTLGHVTQFFFFQYSFHKITRSSKSEWKMG